MPHSIVLFSVIREYLEKTEKKLALVFDAASQELVYNALERQAFPRCPLLCNIDKIDAVLEDNIKIDEWLTFSLVDEAKIRLALVMKFALANRLPITIKSCLNDLFADYLSRDLPQAEPAASDGMVADLPAYAMVCTPRSGSTYLCEMLTSVGLGRPEEHLREREIKALADLKIGDADAALLGTAFMWKHQRNFVFGTKIISHFLFALMARTSAPAAVVDKMRAHFRLVYLIRRDKVGQALSDFLASRSGVWHVRDADSFRRLHQIHHQIEYSFDEILRRFEFMVKEEAKLKEYVRQTKYHIFYYEDLIDDPHGMVAQVARFLGFTDIGATTAKLMKTESTINEVLRRRFVADYRERFGKEPEEYWPSPDIVAGMAPLPDGDLQSLPDLKALKFGQYQKRSWQIADYKCRWSPEIKEWVRADQREPRKGEPFALAFGSAQTFAPYVRKGYVNLLSEALSLPFVNFGVGGAGPDFFIRDDIREAFLKLCNKAALVIFQIQSCRTMGSTVLPKGRDPKNSVLLTANEKTIQYDSERALVELRRLGRDQDLAIHIAEIRDNWCTAMIQTAQAIKAPKILFWISTRTPAYKEEWPKTGPGMHKILGAFPQLVNEAMIDSVKPCFDRYVEVVYPDTPEKLINRFTKRPTLAVFGGTLPQDRTWRDVNDYYPSSHMHKFAAEALQPAIKKLLSEPAVEMVMAENPGNRGSPDTVAVGQDALRIQQAT